jgi:predicted phage tail protein
MRKTKKRFIVVGILICIAGALFETLSSSILGAVAVTVDPNRAPVMGAAEFVVGTVRYALAPLGAALIAIGIALHWLRDYLPQAPVFTDGNGDQRLVP